MGYSEVRVITNNNKEFQINAHFRFIKVVIAANIIDTMKKLVD